MTTNYGARPGLTVQEQAKADSAIDRERKVHQFRALHVGELPREVRERSALLGFTFRCEWECPARGEAGGSWVREQGQVDSLRAAWLAGADMREALSCAS